jgi:hypothetical protein
MASYYNNPYYQTNQNLNSLTSLTNITSPNTDITIPKPAVNLGLRQIQGFEMVDNFKDAYGKVWKLVKRSTDNSVEIPDPQYLQVTDYWCHEVPGTNAKIYCYVVEGIKHPRDDGSQKMIVLYQWFSTVFNKTFSPSMISQPEWHKANVYSTDLVDSKLSKLYALCKTPQNEMTQPQQEQKPEHIEDIDLETLLKL